MRQTTLLSDIMTALAALRPREPWYLLLVLALAAMTGIDWALMQGGRFWPGFGVFAAMVVLLLCLRIFLANNPKGFAVKELIFRTHRVSPTAAMIASALAMTCLALPLLLLGTSLG